MLNGKLYRSKANKNYLVLALMRDGDNSQKLWQTLSLSKNTIEKEIAENNAVIEKLQSHFHVSDPFTLDEELQIENLPDVGTLEPLPEKEKKKEKDVYVGYVRSSNPDYELFLGNTAHSYYSGNIDLQDANIQSIKYFISVPLNSGRS